MIDQLIDSAVVIEDVPATEKEGVLDAIVAEMVAAGRLQEGTAATVRKRLREREAVGSTGIGNGVAVPHVKLDAVEQVSLAVARTGQEVPWDAIDGEPVRTVFFLLWSTDAAEQHLEALRWVSSLARNADFRRFVLTTRGGEAIRDLLREMGSR